MDAFEAIVLGIVQGLTEFLPISSSAHLRIVPAFAGWEDPGAAFTAVTQLGTLAACAPVLPQGPVEHRAGLAGRAARPGGARERSTRGWAGT
jgi:undecaprenyl pyrophosphate phosphatase UppP